MEQRRFVLFLTLSMVVLLGWMNVGPVLFPGWFQKPVPKKNVDADPKRAGVPKKEADSKPKLAEAPDAAGQNAEPADAAAAEIPQPKPQDQLELPKHPVTTVVLGSDDPASGYFLRVSLSSVGAAVASIELNDPRYKVLNHLDGNKPRPALKVVGDNILPGGAVRGALQRVDTPMTLDFRNAEFDAALSQIRPGAELRNLSWEVANTIADLQDKRLTSAVTFRLTSPDGEFQVDKTFRLKKIDKPAEQLPAARDLEASGYILDFELQIRNLGQDIRSITYRLQGPVGVPLENAENTRKYRDVVVGFRDETGSVDPELMDAKSIAQELDQVEEFKPAARTFQYVGVDVQYFTALVLPRLEDDAKGTIEVAKPALVEPHREAVRSDVSVALNSRAYELAPGAILTHHFGLYAGPKRNDLLKPLGADSVIQNSNFLGLGFAINPVSHAMVGVMKTLNGVGVPYGIAIIVLTIMVRGCLFPLSKKQTKMAKDNAAKMQEMKPAMDEIKKKYGRDKQKLMEAQQELWRKHKFNPAAPLAGCLPMLLQLPIFIGLYQALSNSVDLRLQPFPLTWIKDLSAPDALFAFPFRLPALGADFNLLPIITVGLFIVQQKMFMPPAADEQQALQQKMMNYMMVFMGFMFYLVPAGLCVYFIASSLWGIAERKLLDKQKQRPEASAPPSHPETSKKRDSLWARLADKVDAASGFQQRKRDPASTNASANNTRKKKSRER